MTEESHSRNLLAGIPGPICHSRNLLAGIQEDKNMDARQRHSGMTEYVDARQACPRSFLSGRHSGMTKGSHPAFPITMSFLAKAGIPGPICHSRNLLAGIQEKQKHGCPTGNFGHDEQEWFFKALHSSLFFLKT